MCEHDDLNEFARRSNEVTRRQFGAMTLGAGLVAALPRLANAAETSGADVEIKTADGTADAYFVHPAEGETIPACSSGRISLDCARLSSRWPPGSPRPKRIRLSSSIPLLSHPEAADGTRRHPDYNDPPTRQAHMTLAGPFSATTAVIIAKARPVAYLYAQPSVDKKRKVGTTGYCMGGPFVLRTAAAFPDRVGAGATFHGGGLVTDKPDSPHLLIPQMKAHFLIAIAENDDQRQPEAKTVLRDSFAKAKLPAEVEVYAGTMHGWCPPDAAVYNHDQAEKAWSRMLALFGSSLA